MSHQGVDLFDRALLDYAHNFLLLRSWQRDDRLYDNVLLQRLVRRRTSIDRKRVLEVIRTYVRNKPPRTISAPREPAATNLRRLRELLSLDETELALLQLGLALSDHRPLCEIAHAGLTHVSATSFARIVGAVLQRPAAEISQAVGPKGRLIRCGLIQSTYRGDLEDRLTPKDGLLSLIAEPDLTRDRLLEQFLSNVADTTTPWLDYGHLTNDIATARRLLATALERRTPGINLLLYGESGTGKTELAKALGRELGVPLYAARGESDEGRTSADQRLSSLRLGLRIVETGSAMVLFDELEDLFDHSLSALVFGRIGAATAKDAFNRILEDNPAPVIWTTNHVRGVDRAFLRRFSYAIGVRPGGIRQRARVIKHAFDLPLDQPHSHVDALAERYDASPAQVAAAARAARLIDASPAELLGKLLEGSCRLVHGRRTPAPTSSLEPYLVDALNASVDVASIAERLASWTATSRPGISLCLYGPPGTGKSEYVRYLARRLGRSVIVKRASDLLGAYVGESEQRIARAFEQASTDDAILVFDEVDSLLHDRRDTIRSWEVTQVNEMLQQLEAFPGIVACTTNRWEGLDPAVIRRFTFKVELKPPTPEQATRLFWAMFEEQLCESRDLASDAAVRASLVHVRPTPGDFAAVRRRLVTLGARPTVGELLAEIAAETEARRPAVRGFARAQPVTP